MFCLYQGAWSRPSGRVEKTCLTVIFIPLSCAAAQPGTSVCCLVRLGLLCGLNSKDMTPVSASHVVIMNNRSPDILVTIGIILYALGAIAYFSEIIGEVTGYRLYSYSWEIHELVEFVTMLGIIIGAFMIWQSQRQLYKRNQEVEKHLRAAQGEFFKMVDLQFDTWKLSPAEKEVALLTTKGFTVAEIAGLRKTSEGTVKSQNNSIYRKAGVRNRTQLLGALIDELLVVGPDQAGTGSVSTISIPKPSRPT